jgi:hypothetical protein
MDRGKWISRWIRLKSSYRYWMEIFLEFFVITLFAIAFVWFMSTIAFWLASNLTLYDVLQLQWEHLTSKRLY